MRKTKKGKGTKIMGLADAFGLPIFLQKDRGEKINDRISKISFNHRKEISDYSDLVETLFPGNRNQ